VESFVAIDFETADARRDSACAVALVRAEGGKVVRRQAWLIRPPRSHFTTSHIHGIRWAHVVHAPTFRELWPTLQPWFDAVTFIAAHNASFDRSVLRTCADLAGVVVPDLPFVCTVELARSAWNLRPTKLPDVARHMGVPLRHHDALSDASVCAEIVLRAGRAGGAPTAPAAGFRPSSARGPG
jgi:DNA polymerase-3 subunit epsilon